MIRHDYDHVIKTIPFEEYFQVKTIKCNLWSLLPRLIFDTLNGKVIACCLFQKLMKKGL